MGLTPLGYNEALTREEFLRVRNPIVKKDTELEPESQDRNGQESEPDDGND